MRWVYNVGSRDSFLVDAWCSGIAMCVKLKI